MNDINCCITYRWDNGNIKKVIYLNKDKQYHNSTAPAVILYHKDGSIMDQQYYYNGKKIANELQLLVLTN
jgi:hypothetical protein